MWTPRARKEWRWSSFGIVLLDDSAMVKEASYGFLDLLLSPLCGEAIAITIFESLVVFMSLIAFHDELLCFQAFGTSLAISLQNMK